MRTIQLYTSIISMPYPLELLKMRNQPQFVWHLTLSIFILAFALLSGLFIKGHPVDHVQALNWMFNYSQGYNHRGLMGSVFQALHGEPVFNKINQIIPIWEYNLLVVLICLTWLLIYPQTLALKIPSHIKWFLLSAGAVLLLAPIWRTVGANIGFMDKWIFLVSLFSILGIVMNRPTLFLIPCLIGYLIHSMMIFYALLFTMLIFHAIYFIEKYSVIYKRWLIVIACSFVFPLILFIFNNPENNVAMFTKYWFSNDQDFYDAIIQDFTNPSANSRLITARWELFPRNFVLGFVVFNGIISICAFILAKLLSAYNINFHNENSFKITKKNRLLFRIDKFVKKYNLYIILLLASIFSLPIHIVAIDWSRHFYWNWWGLTLAFIYLVWNFPLLYGHRNQKKRHTKVSTKPILFCSACFIFTAYTFGGAPLNVSHINRPWVFHCQQFCISMLTVNPVGAYYSNAVFSLLEKNLLPIHGNANTIRKAYFRVYNDLEYRDEKIIVPDDYLSPLINLSFTRFPTEKALVIKVQHESNQPPNLALWIDSHGPIHPQVQNKDQTEWAIVYPNPSPALPSVKVKSTGGVGFLLTGFSIEHR